MVDTVHSLYMSKMSFNTIVHFKEEKKLYKSVVGAGKRKHVKPSY